MRHIVDIETWERRDNYNFFRGFVNSWYSITTLIVPKPVPQRELRAIPFFSIICMP